MGILFMEIYSKAIALFDDPKITKAYYTNRIEFCKIMYNFLQNSISAFDNPAYIGFILSSYTIPDGQMETFEANGTDTSFVLDSSFNIIDNSIYQFYEGCNIVKGTFNKETRTVTFPDALAVGEIYSFEQYFPGEFTGDFSSITQTASAQTKVFEQTKNILARMLILSWAEGERNFLLDIRNIMSDDDFKIMSNSRILPSKMSWVDQLRQEIYSAQNKLAWIIRYAKDANWGRNS